MSEGTISAGLTGKRRYRRYLSLSNVLVLVLQVEDCVWNDAFEGTLGRWVCVWRDAKPEDINQGELV